MRKVQLLFLLLATCSLLLTSCNEYTAVLKSNDYEYRYEAAKALYMEGHYRQASELFGMLLAPLKGTQYGEESLFMLAESNMRAKDYESAAMFFKKYYQVYPKGRYMEMAHYNSGYALYKQTADVRLDQTSTIEAINEFQSFLDYCPDTDLKEQAQHVIYELQDKLVMKEYLSAKLYYDLGTYTINCIYGGNNYEACIVTAQNALKDYPYASPRVLRKGAWNASAKPSTSIMPSRMTSRKASIWKKPRHSSINQSASCQGKASCWTTMTNKIATR